MIFANNKKQELHKHSFAIGQLASHLIEELNPSKEIGELSDLKIISRLCGYLHDIGKIDKKFQDFIEIKNGISETSIDGGAHIVNEKFSFNNYPRHNEISWMLLETYFLETIGKELLYNTSRFDIIKYVVFWHHAKVFRKEEEIFSNIEGILSKFKEQNDNFHKKIKTFLLDIEKLESDYNISVINIEKYLIEEDPTESKKTIPTPKFKSLYASGGVNKNMFSRETYLSEARKTLIRSVVVTADRIISSLSNQELEKFIEDKTINLLIPKNFVSRKNGLIDAIQSMEDRFKYNNEEKLLNNNRDINQKNVSEKLSKLNSPCVLFGPAGCGKTKILLQWAKESMIINKKEEKIFIVCPRNLICKGLYEEIKNQYLPNSSIEIYTGEFKLKHNPATGMEEEILDGNGFNSDIIITTIDQLISVMLSHQKIDLVVEFLNSYVVFDEFHEFFNISGVVLMFKEFLILKQLLNSSKTLLVSATPNYYFLEEFLEIKNSNICEIETFNNSDYIFSFPFLNNINNNLHENNVLFEKQQENTIVVFNTAIKSQLSSLYTAKKYKEKNINYHSKFTKQDKVLIMKEIMKKWGKEISSHEEVLRAGPILQASLNITTTHMLTEECSAEMWCQRLGRVNRFGHPDIIGELETIWEDEKILNKGNHKYLNTINMFSQTKEWIKYIKENLLSINSIKLKDIYNLYKNFHSLEETKEAYKADFNKVLLKSVEKFKHQDLDPIQYYKKNKKIKGILSSGGLRGGSLYVLPVNLDKGKLSWLYLPSENVDKDHILTLSSEDHINNIENFCFKQKNSFPYSIKDFSESNYSAKRYDKLSISKIKKQAQSIDTPLLLSYLDPKETDFNKKDGLYYIKIFENNLKLGLMSYAQYLEILNLTNNKGENNDK